MRISLLVFAFTFCLTSNLYAQKKALPAQIRNDTLLMKVVEDPVFTEYVKLIKEMFDDMMKGIQSGHQKQVIDPKDPRLFTQEAIKIIADLKKNQIDNPEHTYLYAYRSAKVLRQLYDKYPSLKLYSADKINSLVIYLSE